MEIASLCHSLHIYCCLSFSFPYGEARDLALNQEQQKTALSLLLKVEDIFKTFHMKYYLLLHNTFFFRSSRLEKQDPLWI